MTSQPALTLEQALDAVDHLTDAPVTDIASGDSRDGRVYDAGERIVAAVKVAMITGRPLLLSGPPGGGKSSLAAYLARNLEVPYYEFVCVDESRPQELLWEVDAVRRLADAQLGGGLTQDDERTGQARYLTPGLLWWAFAPASAAARGLDTGAAAGLAPAQDPRVDLGERVREGGGAVVLIDEIDKADNAFSSGLLVPLGSRAFRVPAVGAHVTAGQSWAPLVVISTNNERDLSPAFVRRCVTLDIPRPSLQGLATIARRHLPADRVTPDVLAAVEQLATFVADQQEGTEVSIAEFLDLVRVLMHHGDLSMQSVDWGLMLELVSSAHGGTRAGTFGLR